MEVENHKIEVKDSRVFITCNVPQGVNQKIPMVQDYGDIEDYRKIEKNKYAIAWREHCSWCGAKIRDQHDRL